MPGAGSIAREMFVRSLQFLALFAMWLTKLGGLIDDAWLLDMSSKLFSCDDGKIGLEAWKNHRNRFCDWGGILTPENHRLSFEPRMP